MDEFRSSTPPATAVHGGSQLIPNDDARSDLRKRLISTSSTAPMMTTRPRKRYPGAPTTTGRGEIPARTSGSTNDDFPPRPRQTVQDWPAHPVSCPALCSSVDISPMSLVLHEQPDDDRVAKPGGHRMR